MIKEVCFNNSKQKKFWFILFLDKNYDYILNNIINNLNINNNNMPGYYNFNLNFNPSNNMNFNMNNHMNKNKRLARIL